MDRHGTNALAVAQFLADHPAVAEVIYPGLENHPQHAVARKQMWGFGGMMSFEVDERRISADRFLRRLQLAAPALSLGGVETIICAP